MTDYDIPAKLNTGPWLTAYSAPVLAQRIERDTVILPICSIGTPASELEKLGALLLPPLYHEALTSDLKPQIIARIRQCFPYYEGSRRRAASRGKVEVVELPRMRSGALGQHALPTSSNPELRTLNPEPRTSPTILAFSVDTAVEEHGPHLPLATDSIQSYAILCEATKQVEGLTLMPPVDYGHLVWGLPYGLSVDIPPALLTPYVTGYINAMVDWLSPAAVYVVDVHGSPPHRAAVQRGVELSKAQRKSFRWLHEPLMEWAWNRNDAHAGGVETALIEHINRDLVDPAWWPSRAAELQAHQMPQPQAVELAKDLPRFIQHAETTEWNGIVGKIENYRDVSAAKLMSLAVATAVSDVRGLLR